jgi:periplasmic divalent cation tolerance protein
VVSLSLTPAPVVVLVTAPRGKGREIALKLLERRLAACVNVVPVESLYWWQGRIEEDSEELLVIKTRAELLPELAKQLREIHPYQVPELIALPIVTGLKEYVEWLIRESSPRSES